MKFILPLILFQFSMAYLPTPESLFRNQDNKKVHSSSVGLQWKAFGNNSGLWQERGVLGVNLQELNIESFWNNTILPTNQSKSFELVLEILKSLVYNDGLSLINFLKNQGIAIYTNQELLKEERVKLLEQYIKHLDKPKEFTSPFRFGTNIQKEAAKELVNQNHFVDRSLVSLFKWHDQFFWKVESEGFKALFNNKNHRLYSLSYKRLETDLELSLIHI